MDNRIDRNGLNKYVCVFMSMYLCMHRVERWRDALFIIGICYTMFITGQRSWLIDDLIYKMTFEVLHHTESSETFYSNYFY